MTSPLIMRVMSLSIATARRAGSIIREVMQKGELGIIEKGKNDLQTEADRSAQRCIVASLSNQFPNIKIIGEEGKSDLNVPADWLIVDGGDGEFLKKQCPKEWLSLKEDDLVIWVDPLDGTSEYTAGFVERVTVLIGIAVGKSAIAGVIYQPYFKNPSGELGRIIWGLRGLGVEGIVAPTEAVTKDKFIITTTRTHSNPIAQAALDALNPTEVLRVGGAGYKVLQVIEGQAHAYVFASPGCKKWDTCAPETVLQAMGGKLTDLFGNNYSYSADVEFVNKFGVLATYQGISHDELVQKIPDSVRDALNK